MTRTEVLDRLWEQAEPLLYISKEEYIALFDGSELEPCEVGGELWYVTVRKGPLFHFATFSRRTLPMTAIRAFLQNIIDQHGYVETRTPRDDARQHRFNRRFGFKVCGEDALDIHYRIERLPHG